MSLRKMISSVVVLASFLFMTGCTKEQPVNPPDAAQSSGEELYNKYCLGCHGGQAHLMEDSSTVQNVLKNGKGTHPDFSDQLNDEQIDAIVDYVMSLKK